MLALAVAVGSGYSYETTFEKEVYSDLYGERGVLMGGIRELFSCTSICRSSCDDKGLTSTLRLIRGNVLGSVQGVLFPFSVSAQLLLTLSHTGLTC